MTGTEEVAQRYEAARSDYKRALWDDLADRAERVAPGTAVVQLMVERPSHAEPALTVSGLTDADGNELDFELASALEDDAEHVLDALLVTYYPDLHELEEPLEVATEPPATAGPLGGGGFHGVE